VTASTAAATAAVSLPGIRPEYAAKASTGADQKGADMTRQQRKKTVSIARAAGFRLQAKTCLRLANDAAEYWVAASLKEMAEELLRRANRIARDVSGGPRAAFASAPARMGAV
jgi:hypothetical protein